MYGQFTWDEVRYSRHQLTLGLARHHDVIIVEEPDEVRSGLRRPWSLLRGPKLRREIESVRRYIPPGRLPTLYRFPALAEILSRRRAASLVRALERDGAARAIRYVWNPAHRAEVAPLEHLPLVYHAYDKYDRYTSAAELVIQRDERWLASEASVCFAASTRLAEHVRELGARKVVVVRHGVDTSVFRPGLIPPAELSTIPGPRLGYVGRINEVLDTAALRSIAEARPEWSVVLVGHYSFTDPEKRRQFDSFSSLPNVHRFEARPAGEIPNWLCGLDAGLACYDTGSWAAFGQPIKIYEYLACGLPVIATSIDAVRELGDIVTACPQDGDWVGAVESALSRTDSVEFARRLAFAANNSWEARVAQIEAELSAI